MLDNTVRNKVSDCAQQIENLARQVQVALSSGINPLALANELVRNSSTFTFVLGEMYALENPTTTVVSNPNNTPHPRNHGYHNVRDAFGRFRKI